MSDSPAVKASTLLPVKNINIAAVNINSITSPGRLDELQYFMDENHIDILAVSELKIDSTIHPSLYTIQNFHPPIVKPRTRRGGGTAIYVKETLPFTRICDLENDEFEAIWAKVRIKDKTAIICSTYLPPHTPAEKQLRYLDHMTDAITRAQAHSPEVIAIMGDLNGGNCWLPTEAPKHSPINSYELKLKSTSEASGLTQLITTATRIQGHTHNIRDLIFIDAPDIVMGSGILSSFSNLDHFPVYATLSLHYSAAKHKNTKQIWDYKNADINLLVSILSQINWDNMTDKSVDEAAETLTNTLRDVADRCIPIKEVRSRQDKGWVTTELRRHIRKRDRLFKRARNRQTEYDWARWRSQRNMVTSINRKLRQEHMKQKVNILLENKKDPFKYHTILKGITGLSRNTEIPPLIAENGDVISDNLMKAEAFNSYFCTQTDIHLTSSHHEHLREYENTQPETPNRLDTIIFTPQEILNVINGLDASKACGPDKLPTRFLKMVAIYIAEPLAKLFNKSLSAGKYPTLWKNANVKPVFKGKGSPSDIKNYRPISLLPCVSKILEKLMYKRIYEHINTNGLLTDRQSGYRPGHSTQLQLIYLTDTLYKSLDQSEDFTIVYLDISRYFEKIWHDGLLAKCKAEFGIRGQVLRWLGAYLDDRSQSVQVGEHQSGPLTLKAGVPQGSVLGPLLAIMYLNGLNKTTLHPMLFFADDSSLHCSHTPDNVEAKELELQNDLDAIYNYGCKWAITFNASKTTQQTFSKRKNAKIPNLTFGGRAIPLTDEHKHLGLTFSSDLKFKQHVNETLLKFNRALSPLYRIAPYIPRDVLHQIYNMYVKPHLEYCSAVYDGNLTTFDAKRLEKAQNRAARLITGTIRRTSVEGLRKELGWSSVADQRRTHRLMLFHKLIHDPNIPEFIKASVPNMRKSDTSRLLRNTNDSKLTQPKTRTAAYSHSFIPSTTTTWNDLPPESRLLNMHKDFKKNIRHLTNMEAPNNFYSYGCKKGNILHTRIRLQASPLNAHKFLICQQSSPECACGHKREDTCHYLLRCPRYADARDDLFRTLTYLLNQDFSNLPISTQSNILLNGPQDGKCVGKKVAFAVQNFIFKTGRFH